MFTMAMAIAHWSDVTVDQPPSGRLGEAAQRPSLAREGEAGPSVAVSDSQLNEGRYYPWLLAMLG